MVVKIFPQQRHLDFISFSVSTQQNPLYTIQGKCQAPRKSLILKGFFLVGLHTNQLDFRLQENVGLNVVPINGIGLWRDRSLGFCQGQVNTNIFGGIEQFGVFVLDEGLKEVNFSHGFRFLYQLNKDHYTGFWAKVKPPVSS